MRAEVELLAAWLLVAACGAPVAPPGASSPHASPAASALRRSSDDAPPIDPIVALTPGEPVSWIVPGRVQLELGGATIDGPGGNRPLEVSVIERQGNLVRAAVRLEHARFSVWTDRARLLGVLRRDLRVSAAPGGSTIGEAHVMLRAGAIVLRLAKQDQAARIRYIGAVEIDGWISDAELADTGSVGTKAGRRPSGRRTMMVAPGAVIRAAPTRTGRSLALVGHGYFLDIVRELDAAWVEVAYADGDVTLHGFVSRRDPPGRIHRVQDPDAPPPHITANEQVASGTCLYLERKGRALGYIVGDRDVLLEELGAGWWTLTIDTPWGPIAFAARGALRTELTACAPEGSVPPPATAAAAPSSVP
ncbi:MAG: hypothetical protein M3680_10895 [Myxococcota bacterium]|nr:hypothetical protein [Myxococcota bacterium]